MNGKNDIVGVVLTLLICVLAAAAVLILVPSSPALLVDEPVTLLEINVGMVDEWGDPQPLLVTGYAASIAVGVVVATLLVAVIVRVQKGTLTQGAVLALFSGVFALLGSHGLYCAVRWGYIINDLGGSWTFPVQFWQGGYTMYGAILGGLLGAWLAACVMKLPVAGAMDAAVPGMLLVLLAGRVGEMFTCQGMANIRAAEALKMLPFAFTGEWGDPELAVYAYEAIAAGAALLITMMAMFLFAPAGRAAETGLIIISAWQLLFESARGDELIKFGFVCLNMLMAAGVLLFIMLGRIRRTEHRRAVKGVMMFWGVMMLVIFQALVLVFAGWDLATVASPAGIAAVVLSGMLLWPRLLKKYKVSSWTGRRMFLLLLGAGVVIAVEFALDGKIQLPGVNNTMLYAADAVAVTMMMFSVLVQDGRGKKVR